MEEKYELTASELYKLKQKFWIGNKKRKRELRELKPYNVIKAKYIVQTDSEAVKAYLKYELNKQKIIE